MNKILLLLILNIIISIEVSYGQFEIKDLEESFHPLDSNAHAAYKLHKAWTSVEQSNKGFQLVTYFEDIIKVYDDQGEDYATFEVPLWREGSNRQGAYDIKGATYNLVNGKKAKTKLEKKDIYTDEVSDDLHFKKWAMPNVRAGSIIEISYKKTSPWIYTIPRYDFQKEVPLDEVEYQVQIPSAFTYTPITTGLLPVNREERTRQGRSGTETVFKFTTENVPGLKDDDYVLDIDDYRSSMKYEIYQVRFTNQPLKNYSKSWEDIAKNLQDNASFGKEIKRKIPDLKEFVEDLKNKSKEDKIQEVFSMIQNNYAWNKEYGIYANEGVKDLVKNGSGNIGDLNLLLINLLNKLEIEAKPLCLKSRWTGMLNPYFPSLSELNYVLAYVPMDDDSYVLLDASSKKIPMGQLPTRAINMNGLLITGETGEVIQLINPNEYNYTSLSKYEVDTESPALVGTGKSLRKGYAATKYRIEQDDQEEEEDEKEQDEDDDVDEEEDVQIENEVVILEIKGLDDINDKITVSYEEKLYNELDVIGDQIFIDAALDFGVRKNPFFEEDRSMPIFYNSLHSTKNITSIKIPEGYMLESTPEPVALALEDGSISFRYEAKKVAGNIKINYTFNVKKDVIPSEMYPGLKEIYSRIIAISKQKIVLRKV